MRTHELTGHETRIRKPDEGRPGNKFTVEVKPASECEDWDGTDPHFYAFIRGDWSDGGTYEWMTYGDTPVHALYEAYGLIGMMHDECDVKGRDDVAIRAPHCWCRDVTSGGMYPMPDFPDSIPKRCVMCCRCGTVCPTIDFEEER